jgi:hypothetical protein
MVVKRSLTLGLAKEAPDTGGRGRGFRFRLGGTCDGEGKTHHMLSLTLAVTFEQHAWRFNFLPFCCPGVATLSHFSLSRDSRARVYGGTSTVQKSPAWRLGFSFFRGGASPRKSACPISTRLYESPALSARRCRRPQVGSEYRLRLSRCCRPGTLLGARRSGRFRPKAGFTLFPAVDGMVTVQFDAF